MLPNRLNIFKSTEDQLKKLKQQTGLAPNVVARIAFCQSIERGTLVSLRPRKVDGTLNLDKTTWLGDQKELYELMLTYNYPHLDSKELELAWAMHVEEGYKAIRETNLLP